MSAKTGIDIIHIPRIQRLLENETALRRMLHESEMSDTTPQHIAGIIAAKEAFFKALEARPRWHEIEIRSKSSGKPFILMAKSLEGKVESADLSISHDNDYAIAHVVLERKEKR